MALNLVKLTLSPDGVVFVNPAAIASVRVGRADKHSTEPGGAEIKLVSGDSLTVFETATRVAELVNKRAPDGF